MQSIVVDSGPLIALFDGDDQYNEQAVEFIKNVRGTLYTNLAVITETVYMLDFSTQAQCDFLVWAGDALVIDNDTAQDFPRIIEIVRKYADLPADFADASLIALCERLNTQTVASVDGNFTIYRNASKQAFRNIFFD
jgi:predicted nucleic acid-binding protein